LLLLEVSIGKPRLYVKEISTKCGVQINDRVEGICGIHSFKKSVHLLAVSPDEKIISSGN
jgi:hypothetical protein